MRIEIKKYPLWAKVADCALMPVMAFLQMTVSESLQRTHPWNNRRLSAEETTSLKEEYLFNHKGEPDEIKRSHDRNPRFHSPVFGGWKHYVVLQPKSDDFTSLKDSWYVGWKSEHATGVSLITIAGSVKLLIGPGLVRWFALNEIGDQIPITCIGEGQLGKGGEFAKVPLR